MAAELYRVRSKSTNAVLTTRVVTDNMEVLDEPATDQMGRPLPTLVNTDGPKQPRRRKSRSETADGNPSDRNEDS